MLHRWRSPLDPPGRQVQHARLNVHRRRRRCVLQRLDDLRVARLSLDVLKVRRQEELVPGVLGQIGDVVRFRRIVRNRQHAVLLRVGAQVTVPHVQSLDVLLGAGDVQLPLETDRRRADGHRVHQLQNLGGNWKIFGRLIKWNVPLLRFDLFLN